MPDVTVFTHRFFFGKQSVLQSSKYTHLYRKLISNIGTHLTVGVIPSPERQWYVNLYVNLLDLFIFVFIIYSIKNCIFVFLKICIFQFKNCPEEINTTILQPFFNYVTVNLKKPLLDFEICRYSLYKGNKTSKQPGFKASINQGYRIPCNKTSSNQATRLPSNKASKQ